MPLRVLKSKYPSDGKPPLVKRQWVVLGLPIPVEMADVGVDGPNMVEVISLSTSSVNGQFLIQLCRRMGLPTLDSNSKVSTVLEDVRNAVLQQRGSRNKYLWKSGGILLDLEVRGQPIQVYNSMKQLLLVVGPCYETITWLVQELYNDKKSLSAKANPLDHRNIQRCAAVLALAFMACGSPQSPPRCAVITGGWGRLGGSMVLQYVRTGGSPSSCPCRGPQHSVLVLLVWCGLSRLLLRLAVVQGLDAM